MVRNFNFWTDKMITWLRKENDIKRCTLRTLPHSCFYLPHFVPPWVTNIISFSSYANTSLCGILSNASLVSIEIITHCWGFFLSLGLFWWTVCILRISWLSHEVFCFSDAAEFWLLMFYESIFTCEIHLSFPFVQPLLSVLSFRDKRIWKSFFPFV